MTRRELESRLSRLVMRDPVLRDIRGASLEASIPAWLVGGIVRDVALGRPPGDADLAAGRGAPRLVRLLESRWSRPGFRFRKRGVTTWRFDVGGRKVDVVDAGRRGLGADLRRREFTVNAIAFDLVAGTIQDPLGGLRDLRSGRLRLPRTGVVREDPLRALRAARFLAELPGFRVDPVARREAVAAGEALPRVSLERVRDEIDKLLVAPAAARGLEALARFGLLARVLPELVSLDRCVAGEGRPSVWRHTLDALERSARGRFPGSTVLREPASLTALRWALLLHDVSKPETLARREDGRPTFHGHEVLGSRRTDAVLRRLKLPRAFRRRVTRLVLIHLRPHHLADAGSPPRGVRRLVRDAGSDLPILVAHASCDALASGSPDAATRWKRLRPVLRALLEEHERSGRTSPPPLLDGRDVMSALGVGPGPTVGRFLREARELQEEGILKSREDAIRWIRGVRAMGPLGDR